MTILTLDTYVSAKLGRSCVSARPPPPLRPCLGANPPANAVTLQQPWLQLASADNRSLLRPRVPDFIDEVAVLAKDLNVLAPEFDAANLH